MINEEAARGIANFTWRSAKHSVHVVVRVEDQARSKRDTNGHHETYINDEDFTKYFGNDPKIFKISGSETQYYLSLELEDQEQFVCNHGLNFMNVFERCILIVAHPPTSDEVQQEGGFVSPYVGADFIYRAFKNTLGYVSQLTYH